MTRRQSGLAVALMTAGSIGLLAGSAQAQDGDRDCPSFPSQEAAQRFFESQGPGDPHRLDADDDGIACETLPRGGGDDDDDQDDNDQDDNDQDDNDQGGADDRDDTPRGGVEAGAGGMADPSSPMLPAAGALAGTLLIGGGIAAARRRTS